MKKRIERIEGEVIFEDYPINKYGKKIDWWTSDYGLDIIAGWRQSGLSIADVAKQMGVDIRTFRVWRKKCPKLDDILSKGREVATARVADALYKRAVGFYYDETVEELVEGEMRVTKIFHRYCPPDTKAALSYLYNRDPNGWRAIQEPIDVNAPALLEAANTLIKIKEAAEGASFDTGDVVPTLIDTTPMEIDNVQEEPKEPNE
jgi:lambda repressor-like predicted transcriptional regulator